MSLKIAVALLWAQGVALLALGVATLIGSFAGRPTDRTASLTEGCIAVALAVLLGLLGYWLIRGHRAARGPAVVLELMLLPIGYFMIQAGLLWGGVLVMALGLGVAGLLLAPASRERLGIH